MRDVSIAVLYPYPGLPAMDRGAARRVVPLLSLLGENFNHVTVLSPGGGKFRHDGVDYAPLVEGCVESKLLGVAFKFYDGLTYHCLGRQDIRRRRQWWNFIRPRLQLSLRRALCDICATADVVLLEYPFWSCVLSGVPAARRKPVILTLHDLLSGVGEHPWVKVRVHRCELAAASRAQAVVCVTAEDARAMHAEGINAVHVPHGLVLSEDTEGPTAAACNPAIAEIRGRVSRGETLCIFLGSSLMPNRVAAGKVADIARACGDDARLLFATAGTCCGPGMPAPNVFSLGPVREEDLGILYALCSIALCPVQSGTGASLKVIEAMSRGKALLTTRAGVRGYDDIIDGSQAVVCDDFAEWPQHLRRLAQDRTLRDALAARGRAYASRFDYREVYRPYLDMINQFAGATA